MCGHSLTSLLRRLDVNVPFRVTFHILRTGLASILVEFHRGADHVGDTRTTLKPIELMSETQRRSSRAQSLYCAIPATAGPTLLTEACLRTAQ
jgi:hypothetical protein